MIDYWFAVPIYYQDLSDHFDKSFNKICYEKILNIKKMYPNVKTSWICDTYNTSNLIDIKKDTMISFLINMCEQHVSKFSEIYGTSKNIKTLDCWANISEPGCFQERHVHPNSHFSAIYYVKCPENSGNTIFYNQGSSENMFDISIKNINEYNCAYCRYKPVESRLIVFRSNIPHMVEVNKSNSDRCTISMNFICED